MPCAALDEEAIAEHLERFLGPCDGVLHVLAGGCHVYRFAARPDRNFQTIVTMGLSGTRVGFLVVVPLTTAELGLKMSAGFDGLVEYLESDAIPSIIDPKRPSAV